MNSRLLKSQEGQVLLLVVLALFLLTLCLALVVNVGEAVVLKVRVQGAADAAAFSGALMQARALNLLTSLNNTIDGVNSVYSAALTSWLAAVALDCGTGSCVTAAARIAWWTREGKSLRKVCSQGRLKAIEATQEGIVRGFNQGRTSPAVVEAREVGRANLRGTGLSSVKDAPFLHHWAVNLDTDTSRFFLPELHVVRNESTRRKRVGAGGVPGIICLVPPQWFLEPHYRERQYVLTSVVTQARPAVVGTGFFTEREAFSAVAQARPHNPRQKDLTLSSAHWNAELVRVEPRVLARLRRSPLGAYYAGVPEWADALIRH